MRVNSHSVRGTKCLEEKEERNAAKKGIEPLHKDLYIRTYFIEKNILKSKIQVVICGPDSVGMDYFKQCTRLV